LWNIKLYPINLETCPDGKALYRETRTLNPIRCTVSNAPATMLAAEVSSSSIFSTVIVGNNHQCPPSFSCQSYLSDALQGFCCSAHTICPDRSEYFVDEGTMMPRACTLGTFINCPNGYQCRASSLDVGEGYCCKSTEAAIVGNNFCIFLAPETSHIADGCPPGNFVAINRDGEQVVCDPFQSKKDTCPNSYTCQWSVQQNKYLCCGKNIITEASKRNGNYLMQM
jgi:hypothetical protein